MKPSKHFSFTVASLIAIFAIFQIFVIPSISKESQLAQLSTGLRAGQGAISYDLKTSPVSGVYSFTYEYDKLPTAKKGEVWFDLPIIPFDDVKASESLIKQGITPEFSLLRDSWNYPVQYNAFMSQNQKERQEALRLFNFITPKEVLAQEQTSVQGQYNCRADQSVNGYFKAYFEDVALQNGVGFDHPNLGANRRQSACEVLMELSHLLMLDNTTVTPDILFRRSDTNIPPGALAAASAYFNNQAYFDNGTLHKHIISRQDPTPTQGYFDAFIITNWNQSWDVDTTLNSNTYDFHTVMKHEVLHALGFRGRRSAVTSQTNTPAPRGSFDSFTYKDNSLQSPFFANATLNVPTGSPSSWFTSNQVVYRGADNYINATPDGIRPIYSPSSWQQGSSLSHFDMNRASGQSYVMHPSITLNTERDLHSHEVEVLCHMGYSVSGECEERTPWAEGDTTTLQSQLCLNPLSNDMINLSGSGRINSLVPINIQTGDNIQYYQSFPESLSGFVSYCNGASSGSINPNTKVFKYTTNDLSSVRTFEYTNRYIGLNSRFSMPAQITLMKEIPSCEDESSELDEYICNGGFEFGSDYGPLNQSIVPNNCPNGVVEFWCRFVNTPDIYGRENNFMIWGGNSGPNNTFSGVENDRYSGGFFVKEGVGFNFWGESLFTRLRGTLPPGEYVLSWWAQHNLHSDVSSVETFVYIMPDYPSYVPLSGIPPISSNSLTYQVPITNFTNQSITVPNWQQYQVNVTIPENGVDYKYLALGSNAQTSIPVGWTHAGRFFMDGVSLRSLNTPPPIPTGSTSGTVYQDLNQNGTYNQQTESGLPGIQVSLYNQNNPVTPIQTGTTQDIPNQGKYTFNNIPDGTYKVVLTNESTFPGLTEPGTTTPFAGYTRARTVTLQNGQTIQNQNFGVKLTGDIPPPPITPSKTEIGIRKRLNPIAQNTSHAPGGQVGYTITVTNNYTSPVSNIQVTDVLPNTLTFMQSLASVSGVTYNPTTGIITIPGPLQPNQSVNIVISARIKQTACGTITNTATLSSQQHVSTDTYSPNNTSSIAFKLSPCFKKPDTTQSVIGNLLNNKEKN